MVHAMLLLPALVGAPRAVLADVPMPEAPAPAAGASPKKDEPPAAAAAEPRKDEDLPEDDPPARKPGMTLIAITAQAASTLSRAADVALLLPAAAEACPMGLAPTTSTTMQTQGAIWGTDGTSAPRIASLT